MASTEAVLEEPTRVGTLLVTQVSSSDDHTCAITTTNELYCWGNNAAVQLGTGNATDAPVPVRIPGAWKQVSAATTSTCAIREDGTLWCWGQNYWNEVGTGVRYMQQPLPVQLGTSTWLRQQHRRAGAVQLSPAPVVATTTGALAQIDAGGLHTCAVAVDGKLYCWGYNYNGQLGLGDRNARLVPTQVGTGLWRMVAADEAHTCAIAMDTSLWCWGANLRGQLGSGNFADQFLPVNIGIETDWTEVVAGHSHACARKTSGEAWCWGFNDFGQLGTGGAWQPMPVMVP